MKIIFICGCLEPGKDGVGDYVNQLATSLARQGVCVAAISLYDFYTDAVSDETKSLENNSFSILRIPHSFQLGKRIKTARTRIDEFNPDWLSLQYVPYSFQAKGLPLQLVYILKKIGGHRNWHFMFHELWIGMETGAPGGQYLIGQLQRLFIKNMISRIAPLRINTQTLLYQEHLKRIGFQAYYLPLFSNIPNTGFRNTETNNQTDQDRILLVIFGNIHSNAPIKKFADEAAIYSKETKRPVHLMFIGRCGEERETWTSLWKSRELTVENMGEQTPETISKILSIATAGITTTPLVLVEKSGAVAAMQAHALPVICISRKWKPRGIEKLQPPENIIEFRGGDFKDCIRKIDRGVGNITTVDTISKKLVYNLSEIICHGKLQLSLD